jgi:hypothetical protein
MPDQPAPILVLCRDLLFASKISSTAQSLGVQIKMIREVSKLSEESTAARRMIVDLNQDGFPLAAADWKRRTGGRVIGFVSHVDHQTIAAAKSEGLDIILARSAFVNQLPQLLQTD